MFWKKDSKKTPGLWGSIRVQLILSYALATATLLLLLAFGMLSFLSQQLEIENKNFLNETVSLLRTLLSDEEDVITALNRHLPNELAAFHFHKYQLKLLTTDPSHPQVLFETSHFPKLTPAQNALLIPDSENSTPDNDITIRDQNGRAYMMIATWAHLGKQPADRVQLQIAVDTTEQEKILASYQKRLSMIVLIGIAFSVLLSLVIATLGLAPLNEMAAKIDTIRFNRLEQRISPRGWPKELTGVAHAFDELLEDLEKGFHRLNRFSSDLAHELRTPLTNLRCEAEVMLQNPRSVEEYQTAISSSLEEYERLTNLIHRLLFLAQAENPDMKLNIETMNLEKEIPIILEYYEVIAQEKRISVSFKGMGIVTADRTLFERAVGNLLTNAIKYTAENGNITIQTGHDDDVMVVRVIDNGIGISQEDLPFIFDRFYRADPSRSQEIEGDGLGLSIVKSIMDLHHGAVTVTSQPGVGTIFELRFPKALPSQQEPDPFLHIL